MPFCWSETLHRQPTQIPDNSRSRGSICVSPVHDMCSSRHCTRCEDQDPHLGSECKKTIEKYWTKTVRMWTALVREVVPFKRIFPCTLMLLSGTWSGRKKSICPVELQREQTRRLCAGYMNWFQQNESISAELSHGVRGRFVDLVFLSPQPASSPGSNFLLS